MKPSIERELEAIRQMVRDLEARLKNERVELGHRATFGVGYRGEVPAPRADDRGRVLGVDGWFTVTGSGGGGGLSTVYVDNVTIGGDGSSTYPLSASLLSATLDARIKNLSGTIDGHFNALSFLTGVAHDATLTGSGTGVDPLSAAPLSGTIDARVVNLSGTIDGHFNALSSSLVVLSGSVDGHFNAEDASIKAGVTASINSAVAGTVDRIAKFGGANSVTDSTVNNPSSGVEVTGSLTGTLDGTFVRNFSVGADVTASVDLRVGRTIRLTGSIFGNTDASFAGSVTGSGDATFSRNLNVAASLTGGLDFRFVRSGSIGGSLVVGGTGVTKSSFSPGVEVTSNNDVDLIVSAFGTAPRAQLMLYHGRGTAAATTAVVAGDNLGQVAYTGAGGSGGNQFFSSCLIRGVAAENFDATTSFGGRLEFYTTKNAQGSTGRDVRMALLGTGDLILSDSGKVAKTKTQFGSGLEITRDAACEVDITAYGTSGPTLNFFRGQGTAASTTNPNSGDVLGAVAFQGATNATGGVSGAGMTVSTSEAWTSTTLGTKITFFTTRNSFGTQDRATRLTIDHDGTIITQKAASGVGIDVRQASASLIRAAGDSGSVGIAGYTGFVVATGSAQTELWFLGRDGTGNSGDFIIRRSATANVLTVTQGGRVIAWGDLQASGSLTGSGDATFGRNVSIAGNLNVVGSLTASVAMSSPTLTNIYSSLQAGSTSSINSIYTTILAGTSASDGTFYTTVLAGTSASDGAVQASLKAGVTASFGSWAGSTSILGSVSSSDSLRVGNRSVGNNYGEVLVSPRAGTGSVDAIVISNFAQATANDGQRIRFQWNSEGAYNAWIAARLNNSTPSFLDPRLEFGVQQGSTNWTTSVTATLVVQNYGVQVTGVLGVNQDARIAGSVTASVLYAQGNSGNNFLAFNTLGARYGGFAGDSGGNLIVGGSTGPAQGLGITCMDWDVNSGKTAARSDFVVTGSLTGSGNAIFNRDAKALGALTGSSGVKLGTSTNASHEMLGQLAVNGTNGSAGFVLGYVGGLPKWTVLSGAGGISGGGTLNSIPKWLDTYTLGDSLIAQTTPTSIGVGQATWGVSATGSAVTTNLQVIRTMNVGDTMAVDNQSIDVQNQTFMNLSTAATRSVYGVKVSVNSSRSLGTGTMNTYGVYSDVASNLTPNNDVNGVFAFYGYNGNVHFNVANPALNYTRVGGFYTDDNAYLNYLTTGKSTEIHGALTCMSGSTTNGTVTVNGGFTGSLDGKFTRNVSAGGSITASLDLLVTRNGSVGTWTTNTVTATTSSFCNVNVAGSVSGSAYAVGSTPGRLFLNRQVFTANGTYTPTVGTKAVLVRIVAGGGGGGGASGNASVGGGGAGGSYLEKYFSSVTSATGSVIIGAGGAGGSSAGGAGATGGDSSFSLNGVTYVTRGGPGGSGMAASAVTTHTQGGSRTASATSSGDWTYQDPGMPAFLIGGSFGISGKGGESPFGCGGWQRTTGTPAAGDPASGYGAGGAGGASVGTAAVGGSGSQGIAVFDEYG